MWLFLGPVSKVKVPHWFMKGIFNSCDIANTSETTVFPSLYGVAYLDTVIGLAITKQKSVKKLIRMITLKRY